MTGAMMAGRLCALRAWRLSDAEPLARAANELRVARWMTAAFPHPYTLEAARAWVTMNASASPVDHFAIEVDGTVAGGAGLQPQDGERRGVAEFGYWLSPAYWGRGIATEAAQLLAAHALGERRLRRLEAHVFAPNIPSARVLEKSGFMREGQLREAFVERDGTVVDGALYARLRT